MKPKIKESYKEFETTFQRLLKKAKKGPISLEEFLVALSGKGKLLLMVLLSLGFVQIPGIAMVFGLVIAYLGIRISLNKRSVWLPQWLRKKKIPSYPVIKIIHFVLGFLKFLKKFSCPRCTWMSQSSAMRITNGLVVAFVGVCIAISPPVPLSGWIATIALFLIAIGLLNDDGVYLILGYIGALFYFLLVLLLLEYFSIPQMKEWVQSLLPK